MSEGITGQQRSEYLSHRLVFIVSERHCHLLLLVLCLVLADLIVSDSLIRQETLWLPVASSCTYTFGTYFSTCLVSYWVWYSVIASGVGHFRFFQSSLGTATAETAVERHASTRSLTMMAVGGGLGEDQGF